MEILIQFGVLLGLLMLGYFIGSHREKKHYQSIIEREKKLNALPAVSARIPPVNRPYRQQLVLGNAVIANDYFKFFIAGLRNLFGGRIHGYETLMDRARREALLRLKAQARSQGAELVFNVRYETSNLSWGVNNSMGVIEVMAYGTALIPDPASH